MLGKTNAGTKSGGSSVAEYIYNNTTEEVVFPRKPMTVDSANWTTDRKQIATLLQTNEFVVEADYGNPWKAFDGDETTNASTGSNYPLFIAFRDSILLKKIYVKGGSTWNLFGAKSFEEYTSGLKTRLVSKGYQGDYVIDIQEKFGFFAIEVVGSTAIYEVRLTADAGEINCTLSSGNMTPEIKVYPTDYMQMITQPFTNGSDIIPSQTLIMKPYEDGGNLIGYTDNGSAVNLKMYLLSGIKYLPLYSNFTKLGTIEINKYGISSEYSDTNGLVLPKKFDSFSQIRLIAKGMITINTEPSIIFGNYGDSTNKHISIRNTGAFSIYNGSWVSGTTILQPNKYYWFAVDFDGSNFTGYLLEDNNYTLENLPDFIEWSKEWTTSVNIFTDSTFAIGYNKNYSGSFFHGKIDLSGCKIWINNEEWWTPISGTYPENVNTYLLSPNDKFTKTDGYTEIKQVADLNIPAHIYFNGENWVMGQ